MLDIKISDKKLSESLVPAYRKMNDEEIFSQIQSELAGIEIKPIKHSITKAGCFAENLASLYELDIIIIKEKFSKKGSVSLVFWKKWSKFSIIEYRSSKSTYSFINYRYKADFLSHMTKEFEKYD